MNIVSVDKLFSLMGNSNVVPRCRDHEVRDALRAERRPLD